MYSLIYRNYTYTDQQLYSNSQLQGESFPPDSTDKNKLNRENTKIKQMKRQNGYQ